MRRIWKCVVGEARGFLSLEAAARGFSLGGADGIVVPFSLTLALAAIDHPNWQNIRLSGIAEIISGSLSMGVGKLVLC